MGIKKDRKISFLHSVSSCREFIDDLRSDVIREDTYVRLELLAREAGIPKLPEIREIFQLVLQSNHVELRDAVQGYRERFAATRNLYRSIKRTFVANLNLRGPVRSYVDMGVNIIRRERTYFPNFALHHYLVEQGNEQELLSLNHRNYIIDPDDRWYTVDAQQSVIFVNEKDEIQLAVFRNITRMPELLENVNSVIDEAIDDHRNSRPTHEGEMAQAGFNAGPRSCRIWGLVNNFKTAANWSLDEKAAKDHRILGVMAVAWHVFCAHAPKEIVEGVIDSIKHSGIPEMDAKYSKDKKGYSIEYLNHVLHFPHVSRAPCEGYLVSNYAAPIHVDDIYAPYAFSWLTRHENSSPEIATPGGNYMDISLGVRVISAQDTLLVFRPNFKHGTTRCFPSLNRAGIVIAFSQRIQDAYLHAKEKAKNGIICDIESIENAI